MPEFTAWPKTPRLFRDCVITEKIDGTNSAIGILDDGTIYAQSRNRIITPGKQTDNYGFAQWVEDNRDTLIGDLGEGLHFGRRLSELTAQIAEQGRAYARLEDINSELRRRVAKAVTVLDGER